MPSFKRVKGAPEQEPREQVRSGSNMHDALRSQCRVPTHKRSLAREMWILLLVLVAQGLADVVNLENALSTELIANTHDFTGKPTLKDDYIFSSYYETMQMPKAGAFLQFADLSEGLTSSSGASTDHSDQGDEEEDRELSDSQTESVLSRVSALTTKRGSISNAHHRFNYDENVWQNIYSFLPWQCVMQVRGISRFHFKQSMGYVSVLRMPMSRLPAIFIPCREDLDTNEMATEASLRLPHGPWDCTRCGQHNAGTRSLCSNMGCQAGRQLTGNRLFMGQLRRDGTVPMVKWLIDYVLNAPTGSLISVENRRNTQNQRGKGCAWPTVADDATVSRLLDSHHRMFFDAITGVDGVSQVEGLWIVPHGAEASLEAETRMRPSKQHQKHLPRGPMAIELPEGASHPVQPALSSSAITPRSTHSGAAAGLTPTPQSSASHRTPDAEGYSQAAGGDVDGWYHGACWYQYPCYDVDNALVYETPTTYRHNPYNPTQFGA